MKSEARLGSAKFAALHQAHVSTGTFIHVPDGVVVEEPIEEVEMSGLVFNIAREELKDGAKLVRLTDGETQLLKILAQNAGEPVSREVLANGTSAGADRSVDVQITRLRRKIEPDPKEPIHIQTVRSIGYRLMPDA